MQTLEDRRPLSRSRNELACVSVEAPVLSVAVVGGGYVGIPTALALTECGYDVVVLDIDPRRLDRIRSGAVDLSELDKGRLGKALGDGKLELTEQASALERADAVIVCVPTPIDEHLLPDLTSLRSACESVVENARRGQIIVLTSTSYVGTTRDLLGEPLRARGLVPGSDVFVAFSPERIDPGNAVHRQETTPRVVGGITEECARVASMVLVRTAPELHIVSSAEVAELTKLHENTFRAVNIALANEMADVCKTFGIDPKEVIDAAATKPFGFMPFYPGAGVGGHCIPCDPHYLLWQLRKERLSTPVIESSMASIATRHERVVDAALACTPSRLKTLQRSAASLSRNERDRFSLTTLVVGASYKPGVEDVREAPAVEIIKGLRERGAWVDYYDPLVQSITLSDGLTMLSVVDPRPGDYDVIVVVTMHEGFDYGWIAEADNVVDGTYSLTDIAHRILP